MPAAQNRGFGNHLLSLHQWVEIGVLNIYNWNISIQARDSRIKNPFASSSSAMNQPTGPEVWPPTPGPVLESSKPEALSLTAAEVESEEVLEEPRGRN